MKTPLNVVARGLFATPVAALEVPDAAARNAGLKTPSVQASNAGGWHSDREFPAWGGQHVTEILDYGCELANRITADRAGKLVRPAWKTSIWANVNAQGDANMCQYHAGAFGSGTYYVDDGGCAADDSLGGEFEMLDPPGPGPAMDAPAPKFAGEDGASVGGAEMIRPRPGLLLLFPSFLFHQARPYSGTALRISIAFNLSI
jgi:uncharacterized protein (TIGR02466 family)